MVIRHAKLSDAAELSAMAERTFRDTFSEDNTAENIENYCKASYSKSIQSAEITNPDYVTLVAEFDGQLVAFAHLKWINTPECLSGKSAGEIQRLYVDKSWHGKGLAQELMSACIEVFKSRNNQIAWLSVWEQNPRAISFYKKFNFKEVGNQTFMLGDDPQRDIIMALELHNGTS